YRRDLDHYLDALARAGRSVAEIGPGDVRAYLDALAALRLKSASTARRLSAIRQFHRFLYAEKLSGSDPTAAVESPRQGRRLPKSLSEEDIGRLLARAAEEAGDADPSRGERLRRARLHCLLELLYGTGLR